MNESRKSKNADAQPMRGGAPVESGQRHPYKPRRKRSMNMSFSQKLEDFKVHHVRHM